MSYLSPETLKSIVRDVSTEASRLGAFPDRAFVTGFLTEHYSDSRLDEMASDALRTGKTLQAFISDEASNQQSAFRKRKELMSR